ncbi:UNVERIFIED_CONTAM: hypothetical protein Sradi_3655600 [Sesamum radiatum]|uniref:DUF3444 domain-containing protein n=1 Tax=Sesamum radiatum TaxID=300843 RepID=A0AAW2QIH6_SESRA
MPRFYALINTVTSDDFRLHIAWLEPHPDDDEETRWLFQGCRHPVGNSGLETVKPLMIMRS